MMNLTRGLDRQKRRPKMTTHSYWTSLKKSCASEIWSPPSPIKSDSELAHGRRENIFLLPSFPPSLARSLGPQEPHSGSRVYCHVDRQFVSPLLSSPILSLPLPLSLLCPHLSSKKREEGRSLSLDGGRTDSAMGKRKGCQISTPKYR